MSFLKLDLKILDKAFLLSIIIFSSCQSVKITTYSEEVLSEITEKNDEIVLPSLPEFKPLELKFSSIVDIPPIEAETKYKLPYLIFKQLDSPWYSSEFEYVLNNEYSLPILLPLELDNYVEISKSVANPVVTKPVVTKPVVTKPVVTKPVVTKPVVTKPVVTKPVVTKPVVTKPVVTKPVVTILNDMDVTYGKSFTIEMDQSGWLYETEIENLQFKNKFYSNNKVLFEFMATMPGIYNIEFSKYTESGVSYSRVNVNVNELNKIIEKEQVVNNESNTIIPENIIKSISEKSRLEEELKNIDSVDNPDEIYFKLGEIYFDEGLIKKSKEYFEYVYDNYPLSIYYNEAKNKMDYIINNFLKRR